jgi:hypothetical protein
MKALFPILEARAHRDRKRARNSNITLGIPLPKTPDGRVYRYSPNENAHPRHFLLGVRVPEFILPETVTPRMTHRPGTPGTVCPYSGILDDDENFTHPDDLAAAKEIVAHAFHADAAAAIQRHVR